MNVKTKKCSKCKKEYPTTFEYFTPDNRSKSKLSSWCRFCKRKIDKLYSREYRKDNPEWKKKDNKRNSFLINKLIKDYQKKYPERIKAQSIMYYALKKGEIIRKPCQICGKLKVHAHHQDYSKPLEVIWLCAKHHKAIHNN